MFILNLLRFLRGYVRFVVKGIFVERFLNLAARDRIPIWGGNKRVDEFTGFTLASEYHKLRRHAKKSNVRMHVVEKNGAPFTRHKYRKRVGLLVGLGIFFVFMFIMSRFIWRIEVFGNNRVSESSIVAALEEIGVTPGKLRSSIDVRAAERRALLKLDDLAWIALNFDGSAVHVIVRESDALPPMIDPDTPCNVVALRSGQITSMLVYNGQAVKMIGDTVLEGDVIVSGITQDRVGQNLFKHARAQVMARVQHQIIVKTPLVQNKYVETGEVRYRRFLHVFGWDLPLFWPRKIPQPYHAEREKNMVFISGAELPIGILREKYTLMREEPVTYTEIEAKKLALNELAARQKAELGGAAILDKTAVGKLNDDNFTLIVDYVCQMDVAKEKEILKSE